MQTFVCTKCGGDHYFSDCPQQWVMKESKPDSFDLKCKAVQDILQDLPLKEQIGVIEQVREYLEMKRVQPALDKYKEANNETHEPRNHETYR